MKIILALAASVTFGAGIAGDAQPSGAEARSQLGTVGVGQRARFGAVVVTPIRVVEDSRCPAGVQCIQAGTVRVAARIADGRARRQAVLTLGRPLRLGSGRWLTLAAVCPPPRPPQATRRPAYLLTFTLGRTAAAGPPDAGCGRSGS